MEKFVIVTVVVVVGGWGVSPFKMTSLTRAAVETDSKSRLIAFRSETRQRSETAVLRWRLDWSSTILLNRYCTEH